MKTETISPSPDVTTACRQLRSLGPKMVVTPLGRSTVTTACRQLRSLGLEHLEEGQFLMWGSHHCLSAIEVVRTPRCSLVPLAAEKPSHHCLSAIEVVRTGNLCLESHYARWSHHCLSAIEVVRTASAGCLAACLYSAGHHCLSAIEVVRTRTSREGCRSRLQRHHCLSAIEVVRTSLTEDEEDAFERKSPLPVGN